MGRWGDGGIVGRWGDTVYAYLLTPKVEYQLHVYRAQIYWSINVAIN